MKRNSKHPLLISVFFAISVLSLSIGDNTLFAATKFLYASPTGSGSTCSEKSPGSLESVKIKVRSLNKKMSGDIVVYLRGGTYNLSAPFMLDASDSGTNGYSVIYQAYPGETPLFEGGQAVTGWTLHDSDKNIFKANVGNRQFRQLYVAGRRAIRARIPNMTDTITMAPFYTAISVKGSNFIINESEVSNWENLNQVECVWRTHWMLKMGRISSFSVDSSKATLNFMSPEKAGFDNRAYADQRPTFYHFENAYELLDAEGEWYLNTSQQTLYYKPRKGENMSNVEIITPVAESLINMEGTSSSPVHHVVLKGITFQHTNWIKPSLYGLVEGQAMVELQTENNAMIPGAVTLSNTNNIKIEGNIFRKTSTHGLLMKDDVHYNVVTGNKFTDTGAGGIYEFSKNTGSKYDGSRYNTISYNIVENFGAYYTSAVGILVARGGNKKIEHNTVRYGRYTGISCGWSWNDSETGTNDIQISYNLIHNVMMLHDDGAGIYSLGRQANSVRSHNYIYGIKPSPYIGGYPTAGIYPDNGSCYITVENNVLDNSFNAFYGLNSPNYNNIFQNNYHNVPFGRILGTDTDGEPGQCFGPVSFKYDDSLTPFVTGQRLGKPRNNLTGWMGMKFTVGSSPITVKQLGRWVVSGNSGTHKIKIVDASGSDVVSADVSTSGEPVGFKYVQIKDVVLSANTTYFIVSSETSGGDMWYDRNTTLLTTFVAEVIRAYSGKDTPDSYIPATIIKDNTFVMPLSWPSIGYAWPSRARVIMAEAGAEAGK